MEGGEAPWVCFRCEIQSPSGTGRSTGLEATWLRPFCWPVEEVLGGMALGERRRSEEIMVVEEGPGPREERLLWNMVCCCSMLAVEGRRCLWGLVFEL